MCHIGSGGAAKSDLGCCVPGVLEILDVLGALCLFRLRGSRQNKVKCFIYGRTPRRECCVCVCAVGVASVICVVATRQTVRRRVESVRQLPEFRIQDPP